MRGQVVLLKGNLSLLSEVYNEIPSPSWRRLERQRAVCALILAFDSVGNSRLARIARMAITTSSSMRVKAGATFDLTRTVAGPHLDTTTGKLLPRPARNEWGEGRGERHSLTLK